MPKLDPNSASVARVYDYWLGGRDNFAVDRELADRLIALVPRVRELSVENRQFLARAVTWAANQGITQFADLGSGLPTAPNTHESARAVVADARVVYVDDDPVVVRHMNALHANGNPGISVLDGDVRDVAAVLDGIRGRLDLSAPVCLIAGLLLHFFAAGFARDLVAGYVAALAPGSCLVLSVLHAGGENADESLDTYSSGAAPVYSHSQQEIASFFDGLELVPPGIFDARRWHPAAEVPSRSPQGDEVIVGVARKP